VRACSFRPQADRIPGAHSQAETLTGRRLSEGMAAETGIAHIAAGCMLGERRAHACEKRQIPQ
jgi:hypothetical protein